MPERSRSTDIIRHTQALMVKGALQTNELAKAPTHRLLSISKAR